MNEMVERVARAIYAREKLRKESIERIANHGSEGPWVSLLLPYESQNEIYRDLARAAIEAMREPTPELLEAMSEAFGKEPSRDDPMPHHLQRQRNVLAAFISAALK